jgi:hypothetical protein
MPEDGLVMMLALQLLASIVAAIGWWRVGRAPEPQAVRAAAYLSCAWFALFAALIAYLFDTDLVWFGLAR